MHPLQGLQQRHDDHAEHAEVDRPDQFHVGRAQLIENFRADEEPCLDGFGRRGAGVRPHGKCDEVTHEPGGIPGTGTVTAEKSARDFRRGGNRHRQEVVVVDAGKPDGALVAGLLQHVRVSQALNAAIE
jgi:hypothetical protein